MGLTKTGTDGIKDDAVTLDKLAHGTSSQDGKFLRANNGAAPTFETVTSTTINNNADNRVITGSGTANTLEGESNLTWDGTLFTVNGTSTDNPVKINSTNSNGPHLRFQNSGTDKSFIGQAAGISGSLGDSSALAIRSAGDFVISTDNNNIPNFKIDTAGKVGIGKTPTAKLDLDTSHYVTTSSGRSTTGIHLDGAWGNAGEYGGGISFACGQTGSAAIAARQATSDGDVVGISFFTHDSSTGSDNAVEKVRIHDGGATSFNNGICLGNGLTYSAANLIDDYEEGTWTPSGFCDGGSLNVAGATYTKIGQVVYIYMYVSAMDIPNTGCEFRIFGLPYTVTNANDHYPPLTVGYSGAGNLPAEVRFLCRANTTLIYCHTTAGNSATIPNSTMRGYLYNQALILSGFYFTAS